MVSLQQIKKLENRVLKAVGMINSLRDENLSLRGRFQGYENKILELEEIIENFKNEQEQIETGIINAIQKLDILEDSHNSGVSSDQEKKDSKTDSILNEKPAEKVEDAATPETGVKNSSASAVSEDGSNADGDENTEEELDIF